VAQENTRAIFVETPTNPLLRVIDLEPIATLCKTEGLALLVDSTFATPLNYRPLEHGADVVIHSATKYLNGHSDVLAGAVVGSESVIEEVRKLLHVWGQALDPMAAWLIDRGMKTLAVRVARQNQTALAVAQWCAAQSQFAAVHYPGLPSHADHDVATRILNGFGGMLGVELKGAPGRRSGSCERSRSRRTRRVSEASRRSCPSRDSPRTRRSRRRAGAGRHCRRLPEIFHRTGGRRRPHRGLRASPGAAVSDQVHECLQGFPKGGLALKDVTFHIAKGEFVFLHRSFGRRQVHRPQAGLRGRAGDERRSARLGFNVAELRPRDVPMLRRRLGIVFQDFSPARGPDRRGERRFRPRSDGRAALVGPGARDARPHPGRARPARHQASSVPASCPGGGSSGIRSRGPS